MIMATNLKHKLIIQNEITGEFLTSTQTIKQYLENNKLYIDHVTWEYCMNVTSAAS